ncbi:MAG: macro domain-containing protein [Candidatus Aminicenantes bacterium]|nr:macro domain-containing protein [Candidatus Aminicenantes bacterium]
MVILEKEFDKKKFMLVRNSIIEEKVEAIVNPANEHLAHGGGVAGLISRAGGAEIQKESDEKAPVPTGQSAYTTAGRLPFKYILHTVGPIWRGGNAGEPALLKSAVTTALQLAERLQLKSVSLPSISTGIFGYPLEPAVKIIVGAIYEFLASQSTVYVQEVHLCDYSEEKSVVLKEIIEKNF